MALIDASHYPAVRAAIDISLDDKMLPDSIISLQIYRGSAETEVLDKDPNAATRTGDEQTHIQNATIYLTAARLAPAVPQLVDARDDQVSWKRKEADWDARADELRALAEAELNEVLQPAAEAPSRPTVFAAASGRRGR